MTRRPTYLHDENDDLFDSLIDVEEDSLFDDSDEDLELPFYEDPEELDRMIEEELGNTRKRVSHHKKSR